MGLYFASMLVALKGLFFSKALDTDEIMLHTGTPLTRSNYNFQKKDYSKNDLVCSL